MVPSKKRWPNINGIPLHILTTIGNDERPTISHRFHPHPLIQTDAVLSLDEDTILNTDELDFAYKVWRDFPDRIVGYPARAHYWDDTKVCSFKLPLTSSMVQAHIYIYIDRYSIAVACRCTLTRGQCEHNCNSGKIQHTHRHNMIQLPFVDNGQRI